MRVGVMFKVLEVRFKLRDQTFQKSEHVRLHIRIGILVYRHPAGRVLCKTNADAITVGDELFDIGSYVDHLFTFT